MPIYGVNNPEFNFGANQGMPQNTGNTGYQSKYFGGVDFKPIEGGPAFIEGAGWVTDPRVRDPLINATAEDYPRLADIFSNTQSRVMFGGGPQFDPTNAIAAFDPAALSEWQAEWNRVRQAGDTRSFEDWLTANAQAGAAAGDQSAIRMLQGSQSYDPSSLMGQMLAASQTFSQAQRDAETAARQNTLGDVIEMAPQLQDIFRSSNPQLMQALSNAEALGGRQDLLGGMRGAVDGVGQYGDVGFNAATAPTIANVQGYNAATVQGPAGVGAGQLGNLLTSQALAAGQTQAGQTLAGRANEFAQSRGQLSADELRDLQQDIRSGYAARGTEMGPGAITAEAMGRLTNQRQRMLEDLGIASALQQGTLAEQAQNRGFQQGVQGQDIARQQENQRTALSGALANQAAINAASQFGAGAENVRGLAQADLAAQFGLTNQALQANLGLANRDFAASQDQRNIANQANLAQLMMQQLGADRQYATNLAGLQQASSIDPWQALTGISSMAPQAGMGASGAAGGAVSAIPGMNLFDPGIGLEVEALNSGNLMQLILGQMGGDATIDAARRQASATKSSGILGALGAIGASIPWCWVAREVYGVDNPKWLQFRHWLLTKAPKWFIKLYVTYGEQFAAFIADKPLIKLVIRKWMDGRINSLKKSWQLDEASI